MMSPAVLPLGQRNAVAAATTTMPDPPASPLMDTVLPVIQIVTAEFTLSPKPLRYHLRFSRNFSSRNLKLYLLRSTSEMPSTTVTMFCSEYSRPAVRSLFGGKTFAITSASLLLSRYG